ncbi:tail protein X [Pseudomonas aeruginosa]|uniref:tail protein X n=1 Tax=Pseudomonas aeruginosa TaxID=287 RepID=UPI00093729E6|nr:tail protein X [Pseudomonas aeruginosa]HCE6987351.1 tail protein X [Pseudomonas aeruginosa]
MKAIDCIEHVTVEGERWDTLAWRYYGDPLAYGRIIEANPALDISSTLPSGLVVLVPVLPLAEASQTLQDEELPPWKR